MIDKDGTFRYINPKFRELFGYDITDIPNGKTWFREAYPDPTYRHNVISAWINDLKIFTLGEKRQRVYTVTCKDGTEKIVNFISVQLETGENLMTCEDITEHMRFEEILRESEERYRTLFEGSRDAVYITTREGEFIDFNQAFLDLFGYSKEELMVLHAQDTYVHPVDRYRFRQEIEEKEFVRDYEVELRKKDGKEMDCLLTASVRRGNDGTILGYQGFIRDITERKRAEEALRQSEEKFKSLVNNIKLGIFRSTPGPYGKFFEVNLAMEEITGYSREELLSMNVSDLYMRPEERGTVVQEVATATGKTTRELNFRKKDGAEMVVSDTKVAVRDNTGKVLYFDGIIEDITERKRTEEALKQSEEETRRLAQETAIIAEIGRIISSTLNIEEVYERFADELRKVLPLDRVSIHIVNVEENIVTVPYAAGIPVPGHQPGENYPLAGSFTEVAIRARKATILQLENEVANRFPHLSPVFRAGLRSPMMVPLISKGQAIGVLHILSKKPDAYNNANLKLAETVSTQIAGAIANAQLFIQLKGTEEALRESEGRFRDLYDHAPLGYHEYDIEGRITNVNQTDLDMLRYSREEMVGQYMWKFNVEEEIAHKQILEKLAGKRPPGRVLQRTYRRKDGTTFPVLIEDRLIRDEEGQIRGIRCTIQDISELKQAEEKMRALEEQLRQSQKMEAIGRLAGGIAHDFNNLLTVIKGYSQLSLTELKEGDALKETFEEILKAAQRAADLTRQLLAFSRRQVMDFKILDLNTTLKDIDKMLHRILGEDIELVTLLAEDLGKVKTDPGQIEQVIMNLAVNARDAMPNGGKLTIETANVVLDEAYARGHVAVTPGHYVMLSVSDTGCGMPPEVKDHIFEPFFTSKEKGKGTGLGLSTVYGIVKQSEGNIWVYSEPGQGTTFKIYFPRVDEPLDKAEKKVVKEELPRGNETILLVEDEEDVRKLTAQVLRKQGYKVLEAPHGSEALIVCKQHEGPIHLMVTDVVMPGMSGRELAEKLLPFRPEMKVLYMSGYTDNTITHHGILEVGLPYIQKPFSVDGLARKVREVLDSNLNPTI